MTVIFSSGYALPSGDEPLTHARIAHSGNWNSGGTISASSTATGYYAAGPDNSLTYERWKPSSMPASWQTTITSSTCDYCCISGHDLGSAGATITVEYHNGTSYVTLATQAIADDSAIMVIFEPVAATIWRVSISGIAPEISVIRFGSALQMERPIYQGHSPVDMSRRTTVRANMSEAGQWLGRTKIRNALTGSFNWSNLTSAWVRSNIKPLIKSVETEPFFVAWRPSSFGEVAYCWTRENPDAPSNSGPRDLMTFSISVEGLGYE